MLNIRTGIHSLLAFIAVGLGITCASSTEPAFETCPGDTVAVQVASKLTSQYTWAPRCGMQLLEVYPDSGGSPLWVVWSALGEANALASGVFYGRAPANSRVVAGPQPLHGGVRYRIRISRLVCQQGVLCILNPAGATTFEP